MKQERSTGGSTPPHQGAESLNSSGGRGSPESPPSSSHSSQSAGGMGFQMQFPGDIHSMMSMYGLPTPAAGGQPPVQQPTSSPTGGDAPSSGCMYPGANSYSAGYPSNQEPRTGNMASL